MGKIEHQSMDGLGRPIVDGDIDFIEVQKQLQQRISNASQMRGEPNEFALYTRAETFGELVRAMRENMTCIQMEMAEILDQLPWKHWKKDTRTEQKRMVYSEGPDVELIEELKFEVIDMFHFMLNMCIALGMTWDEFKAIFMTKNQENHARQDRGY